MRAVHEVLARWRRRPFALGSADCGLFAGEVAAAVTGRADIAALLQKLGGTYTDIDSALDALETALAELKAPCEPGTHPLEAMCRHLFGEPVAPLQARRWDVVLGDWGHGPSLGICEGHRIIGVGDTGLVWFSLSNATQAWHLEARRG